MFLAHQPYQPYHDLSSAVTGMPVNVFSYGIVAYDASLGILRSAVNDRIKNRIPDTLLLLEHPPTYTLGIRGKMEHLLVSTADLKSRNIDIHHTDRGGDITFHGPGQLVGYPILDLKSRHLDIRQYVKKLETLMIRSIADFGITAHRIHGFPGVWADNRKIAAIGVKINAHGISSHGFAVNVNTDLSFFKHIIPCGLADAEMTSLAEITGHPVEMDRIKRSVTATFLSEFDR